MNTDTLPRNVLTPTFDQCVDRLRLAQATELARSGNYLEAEALLAPSGHVPDSPRELDLLARIAAHQGRVTDARRFWELALQKDPHNREFEQCLNHLLHPPRITIKFETVIGCLVWAASVFGIATLLYAFLSRK